jgi:BRCA1-associated protein
MLSYFYHLKFELYPTSNPTTHEQSASGSSSEDVWLPSKTTNIFGDLPSHPRRIERQKQVALRPVQEYKSSIEERSRFEAVDQAPSVIDCGPTRAPAKDEGRSNFLRLTERQWRQRTKSFPPPHALAAIRPSTAVKDWRFGRLSIESFDFVPDADTMAESSSSSAAAHGVGPTFGGVGTATKAKYVPLETKNTDVGWGVVHFYREGDETPSLNVVQAESSLESEGPDGDDCSTLCIPAVPSYLSPADFLGFVGEKWRDDVSHYRMVMTARMNRYLVLMKFRDGRRAKEWRKEFDGRVFNSMEVGIAFISGEFWPRC